MVKYDGTVRTANNSVLQFVYGDSGADTTKQYSYMIKLMEMGNKEMAKEHKFSTEELTSFYTVDA